jgi:hypothetical protein
MNRKITAVFFLLTLVILIGIPESFAYPRYGSDCSASGCHGSNMGNDNAQTSTPTPSVNDMGNDNATAQVHESISSITDGNKDVDIAQENAQTGDTSRLMIDPIRYVLGIVGTALVVISQLYSLRKRRR